MANAAVAPSPCWARRRPGISPPVCTAQPPSGRHADEEGPETRLGATIGVRGRPRVRISGLAYRHCLTGTAGPIPAAPSGRRLRRASPTSLLPPRECASPLGQPAGLGWQGGWERGCRSLSRQRSTQSRLCSESGSAPFNRPPSTAALPGCPLCSIFVLLRCKTSRGAKRRIGVQERGCIPLSCTRHQVPAEVIRAMT